ncbi:hypothetical protein [Paracidovorax cattleyae]|uniref:hypothetical protein n=1 Tax=Paracidovorax cattleyae TaxID=80868 RepID=UPI001428A65B|nr:hypothetical protein [Paracidovorax cattleyae]
MNHELLVQILGMIATGAGVYGAIRADLARALEIATAARDSATEAHRRIDGRGGSK